jgi:hypothetical protein
MINNNQTEVSELANALNMTQAKAAQLSQQLLDEYGIETFERLQYRMNCKHYLNEICTKQSGGNNSYHITIACTPQSKCARLQRFDKKTK